MRLSGITLILAPATLCAALVLPLAGPAAAQPSVSRPASVAASVHPPVAEVTELSRLVIQRGVPAAASPAEGATVGAQDVASCLDLIQQLILQTQKLTAALQMGDLAAIISIVGTMQTIVGQMFVECVDL